MNKPFFQPFQQTEDLISHLDFGSFSLPADGDNLVVKDENVKKFLSLDYRVSNPRLLSGDIQNKITGDSFSQTKISNYIVGVAGVEINLSNMPYSDAEMLNDALKRFRTNLLSAATYCNVTGVRGNVSAFVSDTSLSDILDMDFDLDEIGNYHYFPFLVSTSVFYNNYRATIGFGNESSDLLKVGESIRGRLPNSQNVQIALLNPAYSMTISSWSDTFYKMLEYFNDSNSKSLLVCANSVNDFDRNALFTPPVFNKMWG